MRRTHTLLVRLSTLAFVMLAAGGLGFAVCIDMDGDGYGNPASGDCTFPQLDCNDTPGPGAAINPGATELCGDGIDNDCDPGTDLDVMIGEMCVQATDPPSCTCTDPFNCPDIATTGCCFTGGEYVCNSGSLECNLLGTITMQEFEGGGPGDPSCSDGKDNDCNDIFDFGEASCMATELCNGLDDDGSGRESGASTAYDCSDHLDNDNDGLTDLNDPDCQAAVDDTFTDLGDPCTVGTGACERSGVKVCSGDGMMTVCSVDPGIPGTEGPPQSAKCSDNIDNDCDGATDINDPDIGDCRAAEMCDGIDNDGDGMTDEDFQPPMDPTTGLGLACSEGMSDCAVAGTYVCAANGSGTVCDAQALLPSTEGPIGPTCSDFMDNDCDGLTDDMDPSCIDEVTVTCALPHGLGEPGGDCTGYHRLEWDVVGASMDAQVTGELLAMEADGTIMDIRSVVMGEVAHLRSRVDPNDWKWITRKNKRQGGELIGDGDFWHEIYAPVPMLRITVEDMGIKTQAFCSNVPYLQVIEPNGDVVTSEGGDTKVLAAVPLVDEGELSILVDGVDILDELGIDPATAFPGTAMGGTVVIGGHSVMISDITVDTTDSYATHSSNTVMFTMTDLGCGGHVVWVLGDQVPGGLPEHHSDECHEDDFDDKGLSSVFAVRITNPAEMQVTNVTPTPVMGEVCHGLPITAVQVNGKELDVSGQSLVTGDGCTSADTYTYMIDTTIPQTDLAADIAGTTTALGTFDPGSNRVFAVAQDTKANRSSASHIFALGPVIPPTFVTEPLGTATELWRGSTGSSTQIGNVSGGPVSSLTGVEQADAFVIGLEGVALDTFFSETCAVASQTMKDEIKAAVVGMAFTEPVEIDGACDPDVTTTIDDVTFSGDPTCFTVLQDPPAGGGMSGLMTMVAEAPPITFHTSSYGHCHGFAWAVTVTIDVDMETTVPDMGDPMKFEFDFNEGNLVDDPNVLGRFVPPTDAVNVVTRDDSGGGGWAVFLLEVLNFFVQALIFIFTFGQADVDFDLVPSFQGLTTNIDLRDKIMVEEFSIILKEMMIDPNEVSETDKVLSAELDYAKIRTQGLTLSLKGVFEATSNDPVIADTPGFSPTPADAPMPPQGDRNTFFVVSDDALNQLFASMTEQGEMKTECFGSDTGATIEDLLPPDCLTLEVPDDVGATAVVQGICLGLRAADINDSDIDASRAICETLMTDVLDDPSRDLQRIGQGVCHGIRPAIENCNFIPGGLLEKITCQETPDFNLKASDSVLYCMQQENPPPLLIDDQDSMDDQVDAVLRMNDTLVGIIVDRDNNGTPASELQTLQGCFEEGVNNTLDCKGLALCMDLNLETTLGLETEMGTGELQIVPLVGSLLIGNRPEGAPCEGGVNFGTDEGSLDGAMDSDSLKIDLFNNINMGSPPMEPDGLDLGGIVTFDNPRLIAIESGFDGNFQDYIGVAGNIVAPTMVAPANPEEGVSLSARPSLTPQTAEEEEGPGKKKGHVNKKSE